MRCRQCSPLPEEVARAADLLGRRWVLAILWASAEAGAVRFNEFKQALEGIPPRTLAQRLVELEEAGVLERRVLPDSRPPRVEYRLTPAGRRLGALVDAMRAYAAQA
jgi:DNA-binding HxlR family transcriptional regulator